MNDHLNYINSNLKFCTIKSSQKNFHELDLGKKCKVIYERCQKFPDNESRNHEFIAK